MCVMFIIVVLVISDQLVSYPKKVKKKFFLSFTHGAGRLQETLDGWPPPVSSAD